MPSFRSITLFSLVVAGLAPAAAHAGDPVNGAQVFRRCAICHSTTAGTRSSVGPNLAGIVGRRAGTGAFNYSQAMKNAGFVWTAEKLDEFLLRPNTVVRGSRMAFGGLPNAKERADVIAYLKTRK